MAKKTTKKASNKKAKKKVGKKVQIKITIIKEAPKGKEFVLANGTKLKDIRELAFSLGEMADEVFWHHANEAKNDFANWVEEVFKDNELSEHLRKAKDKFNAQVKILKHIVKKL